MRRQIVAGGAAALVGLFVAGALVEVPRVEAELSLRIDERLATLGIVAVSEISGQDATLRCVAALTAEQADAAVREAAAVHGVRVARLHESCVGPGDATPTSAPTTDPTIDPTTEPTVIVGATTTVEATIAPSTTLAPTTTVPLLAAQFEAQLVDGRLVLIGTLSSDLEKLLVIDRARVVVSFSNVIDQLVVEPSTPALPADEFGVFLDLMAALPPHLVAGSVRWIDGAQVAGTYATDELRVAFDALSAQRGVVAELSPRPTASAAQAIALEAELNALVLAEPILFDKGSTVISDASLGTMQRVAGLAERYAGVAIDVEGHTDSEGDPDRNLTLSQQRAQAVLDALIELGVPAADLSATGFGLTQLITDADGNEIPEKSRRVVFGVTTG